nr:EGF-like and EMI domain-containing protein 1 isoform X2 [Rattus norvegicus]
MCAATVDLAANWTPSIAVPFSLQAYLPPEQCSDCLPSLRWEGAEREGIKSQLAFALCWWQMRSWLVLSRPNVCREEQLTLVRLSRPCTRAFIDTIQFWRQGCSGPRWCMGYERRVRYYIIYRHVYATEHQTVFRCCPGWNQWDDEPGCFTSVSSLGTHFSGRECWDGDTQQCLCSRGFHGPHCQYDINECAVDNGGCQDQCWNTIGSYYCICQAGQKLEEDGRGCEDVDECALVNGGCQQRCINTPGTFHCDCDTGYRRHADERTCIKTDPCAGANGCAHLCQSENGMARCACHAGYQLSEDKKACEDINECAEELTTCAHGCVNSKGSFTCTCQPGFELGADGKHCYRIELEIVNICEKNNGGCSHHCKAAIGGPHCSCNHGHQLDTDGKTCIDFDECKSGEACCAQLCINYLGGYECSCEEGFHIDADGCGCDALDDEQLEEEEEEIDILRFPGLLVQSLPQPLPYLDPSLTASYEDEDNDDAVHGAEGEFQGLAALHRVVCLDGTFGLDCSLSCEDCMNGGRCQEGKSGCFCPAGWSGLLCNESDSLRTVEDQQAPMGCLKGFFGKNCKRKCHCANNAHCHRVYGACMCDPGRYGRFCHLRCPRGAYGASCSLECQCVEENTLECNAKNGSCTCKSGYQGNRCQEGTPR